MRLPFSKKIIYRDDGKPYLNRYRILSTPWFKVRLHHILLSDYDCVHDHPWDFVSLILKGGYWEKQPYDQWLKNGGDNGRINLVNAGKPNMPSIVRHWYRPGSLLARPAEFQHAIELAMKFNAEGEKVLYIPISAWSLVIMFKRRREWGFWTRFGFIKHDHYSSDIKCD